MHEQELIVFDLAVVDSRAIFMQPAGQRVEVTARRRGVNRQRPITFRAAVGQDQMDALFVARPLVDLISKERRGALTVIGPGDRGDLVRSGRRIVNLNLTLKRGHYLA
jgi:hypothetical protein